MIKRLLIAVSLALACGSALAQAVTYPSKPIKLVIPFPPGGGSDVIGRIIANELSARLKVPIIVVNAPGAGGMIGAQQVATAAADGYTLLLPNASTLTIAPQLMRRKAPEPWKQFVPVSTVYGFVNVLVASPNLPVKTLAELVQYAKANPDKLSFASTGVGTTPHLLGELLKREANIKMIHVAYKGSAPALTDLLGGQVNLQFEQPLTLLPYVASGKLKPLAVAGDKRVPLLPNVPTAAEQGMPNLTLQSWTGIVAPIGTDKAIVELLNREIGNALATPSVRDNLLSRAVEPMKASSGDFDLMIRSEYARWTPLIKSLSIFLD